MELTFLNKGAGKNLSIQLKVVAVPLLSLFVISGILFIAAKMGISQIRSLNASLVAIKKEESTLRQKEEILRRVKDSGVLRTDLVTIALPNKNPTLFLFSQLKYLAAQKGVTLSQIEVKTGAATAGLSEVSFSCSVDGPSGLVDEFILSIGTIVPLSRVEKAEIDYSGSTVSVLVEVDSYYSEFPSELPSLLSQATDLSPDEKVLLEKLAVLTQPTFIELSPTAESERAEPFSE